ncbi:hypothetical protein NW249_23850 [Streptomyces sp. OUCMDZ-4982]|uniref:hypothetical protein n=1 Tax=Streptomyces sp. OUCMDZ-4982 TaxID=2973090 RepID=UPI00215B8219|nr:hypothetical protein [Streptomyces sp. OUCMDZ-4982]MCR8945155.1 hypothetical protein [Streptomyces sp. OUCMDZ-4982]
MIDSKTRVMFVIAFACIGLSEVSKHLLTVVYDDRSTGPTPGPLGQLANAVEPAARLVPYVLLMITVVLMIASGLRIVWVGHKEGS